MGVGTPGGGGVLSIAYGGDSGVEARELRLEELKIGFEVSVLLLGNDGLSCQNFPCSHAYSLMQQV